MFKKRFTLSHSTRRRITWKRHGTPVIHGGAETGRISIRISSYFSTPKKTTTGALSELLTITAVCSKLLFPGAMTKDEKPASITCPETSHARGSDRLSWLVLCRLMIEMQLSDQWTQAVISWLSQVTMQLHCSVIVCIRWWDIFSNIQWIADMWLRGKMSQILMSPRIFPSEPQPDCWVGAHFAVVVCRDFSSERQ